jgi:catalase
MTSGWEKSLSSLRKSQKRTWSRLRDLWKSFKETGEAESFATSIAAHLGKALPQVQRETIKMFRRANDEVGDVIQQVLAKLNEDEGAGIEHEKAPMVGKGMR